METTAEEVYKQVICIYHQLSGCYWQHLSLIILSRRCAYVILRERQNRTWAKNGASS
jgi:hypothetical protein